MTNNREPDPGDIDDWESADAPSVPFTLIPAYVGDRVFYRVVAWSLAGIAAAAVLGCILIGVLGQDVPESIVALGSTAVGALAGVLASNRK